MRFPYAPCRRFLPALIAAALLIGCASVPTVPAPRDIPSPLPPTSTDSAWWHARFQMDWPEDAAPSWHLDLLIAHRIVKPSLERHEHDIALWRFPLLESLKSNMPRPAIRSLPCGNMRGVMHFCTT